MQHQVKLGKQDGWKEMTSGVAAQLPGRQVYGLRFIDPDEQDGKPKMVRNQTEWEECLACCTREKDSELEVDIVGEPPQVKYKLALKISADKGEKKKIYYPNVYDHPVTFNISTDSPFVSTKESKVTVTAGEKQAIVLRFVPMGTPKEEIIILSLAEEPHGLKHTVRVQASWT
ncbi:hypothetical protein T484DRAFT_2271265 [Baffinella frigidus]|nr:hypothetical protein T484DRAFT_2271265 [Cryptophyta sp. CCMP2293]